MLAKCHDLHKVSHKRRAPFRGRLADCALCGGAVELWLINDASHERAIPENARSADPVVLPVKQTPDRWNLPGSNKESKMSQNEPQTPDTTSLPATKSPGGQPRQPREPHTQGPPNKPGQYDENDADKGARKSEEHGGGTEDEVGDRTGPGAGYDDEPEKVKDTGGVS